MGSLETVLSTLAICGKKIPELDLEKPMKNTMKQWILLDS